MSRSGRTFCESRTTSSERLIQKPDPFQHGWSASGCEDRRLRYGRFSDFACPGRPGQSLSTRLLSQQLWNTSKFHILLCCCKLGPHYRPRSDFRDREPEALKLPLALYVIRSRESHPQIMGRTDALQIGAGPGLSKTPISLLRYVPVQRQQGVIKM